MRSKKTSSKPTVSHTDRKWEVESALRTLTEAERHRSDPKMMADVAKLAAEQKQMLSKVARAPRKMKQR